MSIQEGRVPECVCVRVRACVGDCVCVCMRAASLDGLHIIGREQALTAIFTPPPPPGFVHRLHVPDDVTGFKRDL